MSIILIDKPSGITSFDVIRTLRKKLSERKLGHAGTLDPAASGLIIIGVGDGTKKLREYIGLDKTYHAEILLGIRTDSGDLDGEILEDASVTPPDENALHELIQNTHGRLRLPVSKYSAKKIGGTPLHKRARRGEKVPTILQDMDVIEATLMHHYPKDNHYILEMTLTVSSGTYIRSIAEEIGLRLGVPATLQSLRRTAIGDMSVDDAPKLDEI